MTRLITLRDSLRSADGAQTDSFSQVFSAFLDLTETELVEASEPIEDKGIRSLIEIVTRRHANDPTLDLQGVQMLHYPPAGLFHGGFFAGGLPGTFFYFTQAQQGIVALSEGRMMHYTRITATELPPGSVIGRKRWSMN